MTQHRWEACNLFLGSFILKCCPLIPVGQVPLEVLPYFRFLSEEAQRNVMSQLIDKFQTTTITKRMGASSNAPAPTPASSTSSPEGLAFMRSPTFEKVPNNMSYLMSYFLSLLLLLLMFFCPYNNFNYSFIDNQRFLVSV